VDEVAAAGLNAAHVQQFETLGFERKKVVSAVVLQSVGILSSTAH
jgi:Fungal ubiquitin-associated domain